ncbi:Uncharacterised protein [Shigella sonnei]|nr:Uncharacterised protein [Shigella sonnei]
MSLISRASPLPKGRASTINTSKNVAISKNPCAAIRTPPH